MGQTTKGRSSRTPGFDYTVVLPPLAPYERCKCGNCKDCHTNAKWDRVFAKLEVKEPDNWPTRGLFQSTLRGS